jgi:hypothetical protein
MRTICLALVALLCCATSHAATLTADAVFEVEVVGGHGGPIFDPPLLGEGSFSLREDRWAAFSFDMLGHHWSIDDVDPIVWVADSFGDLENFEINFADEAGTGFLFFDFQQGIFTGGVTVGDTCACGSNDNGTAGAQFLEFSYRINVVPEPGSLTLLTLGLLGMGWIRRAASGKLGGPRSTSRR